MDSFYCDWVLIGIALYLFYYFLVCFCVTDIVLPGVNTQSSGPVIKAGQTVTFIKTQKGLYLRTTDGRILAVRGPNEGQMNRGPQGVPSLGQFSSLAPGCSSNTLGNTPQCWGSNSAEGVRSGISSIDVCNLPTASTGSGGSDASTKVDIVDSNRMNMQELLDKNDITASLASSSSSNDNFMPQQLQFAATSNTMNPTQHLGYPQSLQSLNNLALGENTQCTASMQNMSPLACVPSQRKLSHIAASTISLSQSTSSGGNTIPTTASILSSSGVLASVTTSSHRLNSQQSALMSTPLGGGTVPLAAIGMFAPPSNNISVPPSLPPSGTLSLPKASVNTDSHIPLTLNNLLDVDLLNTANTNTAGTIDGASQQSAIGNLGSTAQN